MTYDELLVKLQPLVEAIGQIGETGFDRVELSIPAEFPLEVSVHGVDRDLIASLGGEALTVQETGYVFVAVRIEVHGIAVVLFS